ncbi:MAG: DUF1501 domain-containing protein [Planctomycetes bacterium]|nr:DUF1501 domain-containing protein [Planctomycetota bacterium]
MSVTRRGFLKTFAGISTAASFAPGLPRFLAHAALAADRERGDRDPILVVLQLTGGNDGLNTVIPYADDAYARARPTLRFSAKEVLRIDDHLGFHPRMTAFQRLFREGLLTIIQGVGYPNSDRSHERGLPIWQTADPALPCLRTGWLGRAVDALPEVDVPAVFVGPIAQPLALRAEHRTVPAVRATEDLAMQEIPGPSDAGAIRRRAVSIPRSGASPLLEHVRRSAGRSFEIDARIEEALRSTARGSSYPDLRLAETLRAVAQLIRTDLGIRIFFAELGGGGIGGFDNHANQRGNHCALLHQLSESVGAFAGDLARDKLLDRVLLMTFSEFGRTVSENGRRGTGHGAAEPMFLVGGRLKGGLVGVHPSLTDLDGDAQRFHTDFRRVYATALSSWLGLDSRAILGASYEPLDIFG